MLRGIKSGTFCTQGRRSATQLQPFPKQKGGRSPLQRASREPCRAAGVLAGGKASGQPSRRKTRRRRSQAWGPWSKPPPESTALGHCQVPAPPQYGVSYRCLLRQNQVLLTALEELQSRCATLKKENSLLHKSCFPETQEKVRHLKRKNAELAVIAKRLEERARKLQEANLKVVNTPVAVKGSCAGLCKKALARQRAMDLREQASVLLAKDKQINALQQECQDLQAKITSGKEASSPSLPLLDFRHLLRESQKEVLRLQRQIALKNFKASLGSHSQGSGDPSLASVMGMGSPAPALPAYSNGFSPSRVSRQRNVLSSAVEAVRKGRDVPLPAEGWKETRMPTLPLAASRERLLLPLPWRRSGLAQPTNPPSRGRAGAELSVVLKLGAAATKGFARL
ncbi:RIMS-binding protein 3A-like [Lacerta agilis]|uniref:RIMS-binding protein 3A-like n=1 Tax=Lacerta agilis TaxID=80427 RepID=UPI00141A5440|nr:RIMS-binding protein 3A-like [Lacerta agilis]